MTTLAAISIDLLGNDAPYGRPSNGDFEIEVKRLPQIGGRFSLRTAATSSDLLHDTKLSP